MHMANKEQFVEIMQKARTIAVVGCSTNPDKAAHRISKIYARARI